jgi:hypothetical protein
MAMWCYNQLTWLTAQDFTEVAPFVYYLQSDAHGCRKKLATKENPAKGWSQQETDQKTRHLFMKCKYVSFHDQTLIHESNH